MDREGIAYLQRQGLEQIGLEFEETTPDRVAALRLRKIMEMEIAKQKRKADAEREKNENWGSW